MKTLITAIILTVATSSFAALPGHQNRSVDLNLDHFEQYLKTGKHHSLEGIYTSYDNRYKIAMIKNKTRKHDYIGVVVDAENPYWHKGEVKFTFKVSGEQLRGFYYTSENKMVPVTYQFKEGALKGKLPAQHFQKAALQVG